MCVDDAGEVHPGTLAASGFAQQIFVLREQHATQFGGAIQQSSIFTAVGVILLSREHIHPTPAERFGDGKRRVNVHVEGNAHALRSDPLRATGA